MNGIVVPYDAEVIERLKGVIEDPESTNTMRERAQILIGLMNNETQTAVANKVGIGQTTVKKIRDRYLEGGFEGVFPKGKKPERVTYEAKYDCHVGLTSDKYSIVGLFIQNHEGMLILRKMEGFPLIDADSGPVTVKGKKTCLLAEKVAKDGQITAADGIRVFALGNYSSAFEMKWAKDFYFKFKENTWVSYAKYKLYTWGYPSDFLKREDLAGNIEVVDVFYKDQWLSILEKIFHEMKDAVPETNTADNLMEQIHFFYEHHNDSKLGFIWLQGKPRLNRVGFLGEKLIAMEEEPGIAELPDSYTARLSFKIRDDDAEQETVGNFAMEAILFEKKNNHYKALSVQNAACIDLPEIGNEKLPLSEAFKQLETVHLFPRMVVDMSCGMIIRLMKTALVGRLGTSFADEDDPDNDDCLSVEIPLDELAKKEKDGCILFLYAAMRKNGSDEYEDHTYACSLPLTEDARRKDNEYEAFIAYMLFSEVLVYPIANKFLNTKKEFDNRS